MSKPAWTPGPWVVGSDGQRTAIRATAEAYEIATVHRWVPPFDDSYEANARLIAEAPAMAEALANALEALGGVLAWHLTPEEYHKHGFRAEDAKSAWDEARAAIKSTRAILARINGEAG